MYISDSSAPTVKMPFIGNSCDKNVEDEAFDVEVAVGLIAETKQAAGVEIVKPDQTC